MPEMQSTTAVQPGRGSLIAAAIAAAGASLCCVAPLLFLLLGIGGTWIGSLTALEPYRPLFVATTLLFLLLAFRSLYLMPRRCAPGDACAEPRTLRNQRIIFWTVTVLLVALLTFPYYGAVFL